MKSGTRRAGKGGRGFTLIELLVVIAIIGILAGILLPTLSVAREHGRRAACLSNLGQISKALLVYANSNNEYLPGAPAYGMTAFSYSREGETMDVFMGHQGPSRHLMIGCSPEVADPAADLPAGRLNFAPVGLGILLARDELGAGVLKCRSFSGAATLYGVESYEYSSDMPRAVGNDIRTARGARFHASSTGGGNVAIGILSSYAYRNTPFYCRTEPDNAADYPGVPPPDWAAADESFFTTADSGGKWIAEWSLPGTRPTVKAPFMTPPFRNLRLLGNRAICADAFDLAPETPGASFQMDRGLGVYHHKTGYNVVYGDGHAAWFDDPDRTIARWAEWADEDHPATDNLTISSLSSQAVWNLFDRAAGLDAE